MKRKLVHNTAVARGQLIGNKMSEKIVKLRLIWDANSRYIEKNS